YGARRSAMVSHGTAGLSPGKRAAVDEEHGLKELIESARAAVGCTRPRLRVRATIPPRKRPARAGATGATLASQPRTARADC
ncbi:MAG TPA: hypothetical protein VIK32_15650, partial [Candidatus Limnocylindrales bacterium]